MASSIPWSASLALAPIPQRPEQIGTGEMLEAAPATQAPSLSILWLSAVPAPSFRPSFAQLLVGEKARPDAVVVGGVRDRELLSTWLSKAAAAVVPMIDTSEGTVTGADLSLPLVSAEGFELALAALRPVIERVRTLPATYFQSTDPGLWLLARLATREMALEPQRDVGAKATVRYAQTSMLPNLLASAERLYRSEHLERHFFDRLNLCPSCSSARLLVREECRSCRSSDVVEEPIIHHLRCAYQGPERDFRDGRHLTCPKCRNRLEHFSVDYDKPGILTVCNSCGHTSGEPAVGFVCLDCASKGDANLLRPQIIYSYALTELGRQAVFNAFAESDGETESQRLRRMVRQFVAEHRALAIPCAILVVELHPARVGGELGEVTIEEATEFFGSMLRETFSPETDILRLGRTFTVMISGHSPAAITADLEQIRTSVEGHLSVPLNASYRVMSLDDFERTP